MVILVKKSLCYFEVKNRTKPLTKMTVGELKDVLQERTLKAY